MSVFITLTATKSVIVAEIRLPPIDDPETDVQDPPKASEDDVG